MQSKYSSLQISGLAITSFWNLAHYLDDSVTYQHIVYCLLVVWHLNEQLLFTTTCHCLFIVYCPLSTVCLWRMVWHVNQLLSLLTIILSMSTIVYCPFVILSIVCYYDMTMCPFVLLSIAYCLLVWHEMWTCSCHCPVPPLTTTLIIHVKQYPF